MQAKDNMPRKNLEKPQDAKQNLSAFHTQSSVVEKQTEVVKILMVVDFEISPAEQSG